MSDDDFWDIDQYLTTRRNREIGSDRIVEAVRPSPEVRAYDASAERVQPVGRDMPERRRRQRRQPRDIAEIHGLDEAQLDGSVRDALADLVQEIGLLHDDLRLAEGRIHFLEDEMRHDLLGDWLDRKGFIGSLSRLLTLDEQEEAHSSLVLVRLEGFAELRRAQGWTVADDVIADLGGRLQHIGDSVVGHVADNMFGILLVGMPADAAEAAMANLLPTAINVSGAGPVLPVTWAAIDVEPEQGELELLSTAERKLARESAPAKQ